jgi:hypothetical protein
MTKYKCIKRLVVPELEDYDGVQTGNDFIVEVGEVFVKEDGEELLTNDIDGTWVQLDDHTLEEHFKDMEESE